MQTDDGTSNNPPYLFQRYTAVATDTLMMSGKGPSAKVNGLSRSLFRPSDDAVTLPYNIPGNAMACTELHHTIELLKTSSDSRAADLISSATTVANGICSALDGILKNTKSAIPFEIDGFGSEFYMDDANVPSLLALPVLGYISPSHPTYLSTRQYVLSDSNPFYFKGTQGEGVGGPHVGYNYAWPMAIIQRAMTSENDEEVILTITCRSQ
jgi:meiotically up-regulated gene 157 (Mug157) protein